MTSPAAPTSPPAPRPRVGTSLPGFPRALVALLVGLLLALAVAPVGALLAAGQARAATAGPTTAGPTTAPTETSATGTPATGTPSTDAPTAEDFEVEPPTVLVGLGGLRWNDVSASTTPSLWRMIDQGSVASINVRTANPLTCPLDAWLTLSAGRRTQAVPEQTVEPSDDATDDVAAPATCLDVPQVTAPAQQPGPVTVPGWTALTRPAEEGILETETAVLPGELGESFATADACRTAVGPGAAVMLADATGHVDRYAADLAEVDDHQIASCGTLVVDLGDLPEAGPERMAALDSLDATLVRLRAALPPGSRVLVAGVTGAPLAQPDLQVVVDWTSGEDDARWSTSEGTRRPGLVQLADLTATIAADAGVETAQLDGHPLEDGEERRSDVSGTVENRRYVNVLTTTIPQLMPVLVTILGLALAGCVVGALWARRRAARHGAAVLPPGPGGRRLLVATTLVVASAPVGTPLAALSRWWVLPAPTFVLVLAICVATAAVAVASWLLSRVLPASPWRLATCVAGITWLVLVIDGLTGTTLQQGSLLGSSLAQGARFYGFNNMTFAIFAVAGLTLAAGLASSLARAGRRSWALVVIAAVGVVTTVIDGGPQFGADFGGILALVPGFAVLVLLVAGVRITWRRVAALALVTLLVVGTVAVLDWAGPGEPSHLGGFVQRIVDGEALSLVASKAAGAWSTVANPAGVVVLPLLVLAVWAVLRPERLRMTELAEAYRRWPLLRPLALALATTGVVGSVLNDSGIVVGGFVLVVAVAMLVPSLVDDATPAGPAGTPRVLPTTAPGVRSMTGTLVTLAGGLLVTMLLATLVAPGTGPTGAGTQVAPSDEQAAVPAGGDLVVVGTAGVRWDDVSTGLAPTIRSMLSEDAGAAGDSLPTGTAARCPEGGWLAISAGVLADATATSTDGVWDCPDLSVTGERVDQWDDLVALQDGSRYQAHLGRLGDQLDGVACTSAVGPGAAVALATSEGTVDRYTELADAFDGSTGSAFGCPVTVVDAGDATDPTTHAAAVAGIDAVVAKVLDAVPASTTVLVVDVANTPGEPPALGVTVLRPGVTHPDSPAYLTSAATRTDGVVRLLDVPATVLAATGTDAVAPLEDTPITYGSPRPPDAVTAADEIADLTALDVVRRSAYTSYVDLPFYAGIALALGCLLAGAWRRRRGLAPLVGRPRRAVEAAALVVAAVPTAAFLVSLTAWWRFDQAGIALLLSTLVMVAATAGLALLAPRRPVWAGPALLAGLTFAMLTLDALVGTPLNRASPLGSAPTYGARFYGFGNPTFSVYAVAAVIASAALAQWLVQRGRRRTAAVTVAALGLVAMYVDVGPTLGADLGGGLVLAPTFAVLVLAASGARVTLRRFVLVGAVGVLAVAAVGVLDWLRPPAERSHLGRFVGQVIDGEAWSTLLRKAGFALRSLLGGVPVWITLAVLVAVALVLFVPRLTPRWFARTEATWPLVRPAVLAIWVASVTGSLVNDFGIRIAMIALVPAVPLLLVAFLRGDDAASGPADAVSPGPGRDVSA
ncbi:hypothetical protein CLV28_3048 [Sediminihabitans luteus]|uniref:Uncharacterized protein n=1 Tax=Sediminihabitans luteus TaxID=1138585 RepID=A0A2M9CC10_9CELL|nr:hypothetical protein [Sediminihabitans luteus]PJJ68632.1 hypothetical protein CLV28_3048 [Sediminihabitans luteus]GII99972.1 hypothetical protein Slu03_23500 [Sediminihabitans luteus]